MEENKKICFPFVGDNIGGSNISSLLLITALKKTFSSTEIVTHSNGFFTKYLKKKEIKYFKLKNKTFLGEKPFFQIKKNVKNIILDPKYGFKKFLWTIYCLSRTMDNLKKISNS